MANVDALKKYEYHSLVFSYGKEFGKEFDEVWTKTSFEVLMFSKIVDHKDGEYSERFNHVWKALNETPVKK